LKFISKSLLANFQFLKGRGSGVRVNLLVGIADAIIGGLLPSELGIHLSSGLIGSLIAALIGTIVLLFVISLFKK